MPNRVNLFLSKSEWWLHTYHYHCAKEWKEMENHFFLCQTRLVCHVISWSNAHFRVTFCNIVQDKSSAVGTRGAGEWSPPPPLQDFGRYVKSYFFMGAVYAHYINTLPPPPDFQACLRSWLACCLLPKLQTNAQKKIQHLTLLVRSFK